MDAGGGLAFAADAAPLAPGHLLLHPFEHLPSLAAAPAPVLSRALHVLRATVERYRRGGLRTLLFEHGTTGISSGSGCVDHAHVHVLPIGSVPPLEPETLPSDLLSVQDRIELEDIPGLAGRGYYWIADDTLRPLIFAPLAEERQAMRRIVARLLGGGQFRTWDLYDIEAARRTTGALAPHVSP